MVDEAGFQLPEQGRKLLDRHLVLRELRIVAADSLHDHLPREFDQLERLRRRRVHENLAFVDSAPALPIGDTRIEMNGRHVGTPLSSGDAELTDVKPLGPARTETSLDAWQPHQRPEGVGSEPWLGALALVGAPQRTDLALHVDL